MKEKENQIKMPTAITISKTPSDINLENIEIFQGQCFINSYRVAKKYPSVEIVEGIIVVPDNEIGPKPLPHVWNKKDDVHFDITSEKVLADKEEMNHIDSVKYFCVMVHKHSDFKNGDMFEFCDSTNLNVDAIKEVLNKKD